MGTAVKSDSPRVISEEYVIEAIAVRSDGLGLSSPASVVSFSTPEAFVHRRMSLKVCSAPESCAAGMGNLLDLILVM